ncbi:hypothetical protein LPB140_06940 [Sphingorhabdus lutea]|uniref:Uncharacterized protein n=2 Tax=Sphingorhabdus lutea TaxID=1913578 RepID=A0A1L3JBP9_9SPHN|nr:hypothetical protein LPB140_06940 [Sphingorhabdus lutea]
MGNDPVTLTASETDPCSYGVIAQLPPESAIDVYPGPSTDLEPIGQLAEAHPVWICETSNDSEMVGIVYSAFAGNDSEPAEDCGVSSPVAEDIDYLEPCESGWIMAEDVELLAG